jgi:hypothetical protein
MYTYCLSTTTMVIRTRLIVTLYVHCLCCYILPSTARYIKSFGSSLSTLLLVHHNTSFSSWYVIYYRRRDIRYVILYFYNYNKFKNLQAIQNSTAFNIGPKFIFTLLYLPDCWPEVSIRKVLQPATSAQVFLCFPVSKNECWDGSQDSKLLLYASHVTLPTKIS